MPKVSVGTFNVENLFMRYKLLDNERGSRIPKPVDPDKFIEEGGHINMLGFTLEDFGLISRTARKNSGDWLSDPEASAASSHPPRTATDIPRADTTTRHQQTIEGGRR